MKIIKILGLILTIAFGIFVVQFSVNLTTAQAHLVLVLSLLALGFMG